MLVAPRRLWLLVSTTPLDVSTMPVPAAVPLAYPSVLVTSTTAPSTAAATAEASPAAAGLTGAGLAEFGVGSAAAAPLPVCSLAVRRPASPTAPPAPAPAPQKRTAAPALRRRARR